MRNKRTKKSLLIGSKRKLLISLLVIFVLAVIVLILEKAQVINLYENKGDSAQGTDEAIDFGPPTEQEKQAGDNAKEQIIQKEAQQNANQNQSGLKNVTPVITYSGRDEVNAYVPGIFEEDGVCSALFTQGQTSVTRSSTGFANVSDTQCEPIYPDLPNASSWSVVVSYKSATSVGSSGSSGITQ